MAMKRTGEPFYMTIAAELKDAISAGELNPGDMLSSENELAKRYDTSRVTVRKSLELLEHEGFVHSWQGKGYFVNQPAHEDFSIKFSEDEYGFDAAFHSIHAIKPSEAIRGALEVGPKQMVLEICRIIKKNDQPVALDYKYVPYDRGEPTLEAEIDYAVFPEIAAAKSSPFAFHTRMEIAAELPSVEVCDLLKCAADTPVLVVYRHLIDLNGRHVGYGMKYMLEEYGRIIATSGYGGD